MGDMKLLIFNRTCTFTIAAHQLMRVVELSRQFKKVRMGSEEIVIFHLKGNVAPWFCLYRFFLWQVNRWLITLPGAASEHGLKVDALWNYNMYLISFVFLLW